MLRLPPTRLELKPEDVKEQEAAKAKLAGAKSDAMLSGTSKTPKTKAERIGLARPR